MKKIFDVQITVTYRNTVEIIAETEKEAEMKAAKYFRSNSDLPNSYTNLETNVVSEGNIKMKNLSTYAKQRLDQRAERIEREKETRKDRLKAILWAIADGIAWLVVVIGITAVTMIDSVSFVPGIIVGVSAVYLAIYGAFRGVLG